MLVVKKRRSTLYFPKCAMCGVIEQQCRPMYSVYTDDYIWGICSTCREVVLATMTFKVNYVNCGAMPHKHPIKNVFTSRPEVWDVIEE